MSLTAEDLWSIRDIIKDEVRDIFQREGKKVMRDIVHSDVREIVHDAVNFELNSLNGRATGLENDVKEIYHMLAKMQRGLAAIAKQVGVNLPR